MKKNRMSKEERDAMDARIDETLRRLRTLAEKARAEIDRKKRESGAG